MSAANLPPTRKKRRGLDGGSNAPFPRLRFRSALGQELSPAAAGFRNLVKKKEVTNLVRRGR